MQYKPVKPLRDTAGKPLPFRDPTTVERLIGKRRRAQQIGTGFYEWPLWQAHPTWHQFHDAIDAERTAAAQEGRPPHRAAADPPPAVHGNTKLHPDELQGGGTTVERAKKPVGKGSNWPWA